MGDDPEHALNEAVRYAERALDLDPTLAQAHTALAYAVMMRDLDFERAEAEFGRALELDPGYATAHQWLAELLSATGRHDEAVLAARKAESLDPTMIIRWNVARVLYFAGRYEEAIGQVEAIALDGGRDSQYRLLSYYMLEDYDALASMLLEAQEQGQLPDRPPHSDDDRDGGPGDVTPIPPAEEIPRFLARMAEQSPDSSPRQLQIAAALWTRVDPDTALARLAELASDPGDPAVRAVWFEVLVDPMFDPLRDDPRYEELNARFGL